LHKNDLFSYFLARGLLKGDLNEEGKIQTRELKCFFEKAQDYDRIMIEIWDLKTRDLL